MSAAAEMAMHAALLLGWPPLLLGIINRVKALAAGRNGPPVLQPYRDVLRLLRKGAVYSRTTTWVFRAAPLVALAATLMAGCLVPLRGAAPVHLEGDIIAFAYLLALARFAMLCAAFDTGSSFEGMGASREAAVSALAELALFLVLATLVLATRHTSLSGLFAALARTSSGNPALWLAAAALGAVLLAENARIPIDDPATHLELTMIHEVMVLDHSGPDLAAIEYTRALKLFVTAALLLGVIHPSALGHPLTVMTGSIAVALVIGVVESAVARLRMPRVKQFLIGAAALAAVGLAAELVVGPVG